MTQSTAYDPWYHAPIIDLRLEVAWSPADGPLTHVANRLRYVAEQEGEMLELTHTLMAGARCDFFMSSVPISPGPVPVEPGDFDNPPEHFNCRSVPTPMPDDLINALTYGMLK